MREGERERETERESNTLLQQIYHHYNNNDSITYNLIIEINNIVVFIYMINTSQPVYDEGVRGGSGDLQKSP